MAEKPTLKKPFDITTIDRKDLVDKGFTIIHTQRKEDQFREGAVFYTTYIVSHADGKLYKCFFKGVAMADFLERVISGEIFLPCYAEVHKTQSASGHEYLHFVTFWAKHGAALDAEEQASF